jgi:homocysteine S-methyltransferase
VDDVDGTRLRSGEPLIALAPMLQRSAPAALLINCSRPEVVTAGLDIVATFGMPFGAYANGFTQITEAFINGPQTVDKLTQRRDLDPSAYARFAMQWLDQGASIVGGCCEIGPAHISELARQIDGRGYEII